MIASLISKWRVNLWWYCSSFRIGHCLVDRRHFECLLDIVPTMSRFLTSVTLVTYIFPSAWHSDGSTTAYESTGMKTKAMALLLGVYSLGPRRCLCFTAMIELAIALVIALLSIHERRHRNKGVTNCISCLHKHKQNHNVIHIACVCERWRMVWIIW